MPESTSSDDFAMSTNPFQSPTADCDVVLAELAGGVPAFGLVDGKYLVVPSRTVLPPVCVRTNQPVPEDDMLSKTFDWCSPWVALLILLNVLVLIVVYFIVRKKCTLKFGLHSSIRKRYRKRVLIKSVVAIVLFIAIPFSAAGDVAALPIMLLVLFIAAIVSFFIGRSPLGVAKYRDGMFWIKGCSPEFLANIEQHYLR